jgi:hypothetical protein
MFSATVMCGNSACPEHGVDVPGVRRDRDVAVYELDPPGVRSLEPGDQPEQVVLPDPDGPSRVKNPGRTTRSTSASAVTSPYRSAGW